MNLIYYLQHVNESDLKDESSYILHCMLMNLIYHLHLSHVQPPNKRYSFGLMHICKNSEMKPSGKSWIGFSKILLVLECDTEP